MLECTLDGLLVYQLVSVLRTCVERFALQCDEKGISMQALESGSVAIIALHMDAQKLPFYRCDVPICLGIKCETFCNMINDAVAGDTLTLKKMEDEQFLNLELASKTISSGDNYRHFEFPLDLTMTGDDDLCLPEDKEYPAEIVVKANRLMSAMNFVQKFSTQITMHASKKQFWLSVSTDRESIDIHLTPISIHCDEPVSNTFHRRVLHKICKLHCLSDDVRIGLAPAEPVRLAYDLTMRGVAKDQVIGEVVVYHAPFVEDQEDEEVDDQENQGNGGELELDD